MKVVLSCTLPGPVMLPSGRASGVGQSDARQSAAAFTRYTLSDGRGCAQPDQAMAMPHDISMSKVQAVQALGWAVTLLSPAGGRKAKEGRTSDLRGVSVAVTAYVNGEPRTQLELLEGFQKIPFGTGVLSCHIAAGFHLCNGCHHTSTMP